MMGIKISSFCLASMKPQGGFLHENMYCSFSYVVSYGRHYNIFMFPIFTGFVSEVNILLNLQYRFSLFANEIGRFLVGLRMIFLLRMLNMDFYLCTYVDVELVSHLGFFGINKDQVPSKQYCRNQRNMFRLMLTCMYFYFRGHHFLVNFLSANYENIFITFCVNSCTVINLCLSKSNKCKERGSPLVVPLELVAKWTAMVFALLKHNAPPLIFGP